MWGPHLSWVDRRALTLTLTLFPEGAGNITSR